MLKNIETVAIKCAKKDQNMASNSRDYIISDLIAQRKNKTWRVVA